jgi:prevent-host-death family protein
MDTENPDQSIAEARANLSELLASTRLLKRVYFLTSRGKRQAAVIPAELGSLIEQAGGPERVAEMLSRELADGRE